MNRDKIERALRDPGPREAGYEERPLDLSSAGGRGGVMQTTLRFASYGAVVAAGVLVALVLTRGSFFGPVNPGAGSATPSPSANPARPCTSEDFAWTTDPWGGAAGSVGTNLTIRGVASLDGCRINGPATLTVRDANGAVVIQGETPKSDIAVKAGSLFEMGIHWSNWCGNLPAAPLTATLTLPLDHAAAPLIAPGSIPTPECGGTGESSTLGGTNFQPSSASPPEG